MNVFERDPRTRRWRRATTLLPGLVLVAGCAGFGLEDVLGGLPGTGVQDGELVEVQQVDTRNREIEVMTEDGVRDRVLYDERTRVRYEGRDYEVRALERGDLVRMRLRDTRTGEPYAELIEVERSADERGGGGVTGSVERVEGEVGWLDRDGGRFILETRNAGIMVFLPRNPPSDMVRTFRNLDRGDWIRAEIRPLDRDEAELVRFGWR